jgi:hypothetical protein
LSIAIVPRYGISNALPNKTLLLPSFQVLSHKPSLALVVVADVLVAALVVVLAHVPTRVLAIVRVAVLSHARVVVILSSAVVAIPVQHRASMQSQRVATLVIHVQLVALIRSQRVSQETPVQPIALTPSHRVHAQAIHALLAVLIPSQQVLALAIPAQPAHALANQKQQEANGDPSAVTKHATPKSPPFCLESSRFRWNSPCPTAVANVAR